MSSPLKKSFAAEQLEKRKKKNPDTITILVVAVIMVSVFSISAICYAQNAVSLQFYEHDRIEAARWVNGIGAGDLNNDNNIDLVIPSYDADILVFLGNGGGSFGSPSVYNGGYRENAKPLIADFNYDGFLDAAICNNDGRSFTLLIGDGTGNLSTHFTGNTSRYPEITMGDFNDDGKLDIASCSWLGNIMTVFINNGDGTFNSHSYSVGAGMFGIAAGDYNGDGKTDLVVTVYYSHTIIQFWGNGDGTFTQGNAIPVPNNGKPSRTWAADFNNDGVDDLAVHSGNDDWYSIPIYLGVQGGELTYNHSLVDNNGQSVIGHVNNDDFIDIVSNESNSKNVHIYVGNGDGSFTEALLFSYPQNDNVKCGYVELGDFNSDGLNDIAVGLHSEDSVNAFISILLNTLALPLTLTSPNGSESWEASSTHNITWTSSGVTNVKLEYSTNNGSDWTEIVASTPAAAGYYEWMVPDTPSTTCLVKISDASNAVVADYSDAVFKISSNTKLIAYYPFNGNANDESGKGHTGNVTGAVLTADRYGAANSAYSFDGSGDIIEVSDAPDLHILSKITLSAWVKPNVITFSNIIHKRDDRTIVSVSYGIWIFDTGEIDFNFGNNSHCITSGYGLEVGLWTHIAVTFDDASDTLIFYKNGQVHQSISTSRTIDDFNDPIAIGGVRHTDSSLYGVFNGSIDEVRIYNYDLSAQEIANLSPSAGTITITSPNGSESWEASSTHNITWTSSGVTNVKLEYTTNNGSSWTQIIASTSASVGNYSWTVPIRPSVNCKLRISDASDAGVTDTSTSAFTITESTGETIVFQSKRDVSNEQIYVMNPDGSNPTRITYTASRDQGPAWSPDGTKITFFSYRDNGADIYTMDADGSNQTKLTNHVYGVTNATTPSWSPDGTKIVYESWTDGDYDIYVMNVDGTNQIDLTKNSNPDNSAHWSPDGSKIVFASGIDGNSPSYDIYVMNADGSNLINLTNNSTHESCPVWSPDGSKIAFRSIRDGKDDVYVMDPDGSSQTKLTNITTSDLLPKWSPDGSKIAFSSIRDGNAEIYVMNSDGSNQTRLTNNSVDDYYASWARPVYHVMPAAKSVALTSPTGGESWEASSSHNITWTSSDVANVKLEYSTNNGSDWTEIVASTPAAAGSYEWMVPDTPSTTCLVKISDASNTVVADYSDGIFTITEFAISQKLKIDAPESALPGDSFWFEIKVQDVQDLFGVSFVLNYTNGEYIEEVSTEAGDFLGDDILFYPEVDKEASKVSVGLSRKGGQGNVNGSGVLVRIQFTSGSNTPYGTVVDFSLSEIMANDKDGKPLSLGSVGDATTVTLTIPVFPGDTNNNGLVDQTDVLPLGLYWAEKGPARPDGSYKWEAQICQSWYPEAATYADATGDGTVNQGDMLPIGLNWNKTHSVPKIVAFKVVNTAASIKPVPLLDLPLNAGDEFWVEIQVEDVSSLFGLSFVLTYDNNEYIEPLSAESGIFMGEDVVFFLNINKKADEVAVGITRKAGQGDVNGSGTVVKIKLKMLQNLENGFVITFFLNDVVANDQSGTGINLTIEDGQIEAGVSDELSTLPKQFSLSQNYPNPFNPLTSIEFAIPLGKSEHVRLNIYDLRGVLVRTLVDEVYDPGTYSAMWDGTNYTGNKVSSGVYIYRLQAGKFTKSNKMLLVR